MIRAVIFDFDGVIVESVDVKTNAFAELYRPYGEVVVQQVIDHHQANGGVSRFDKIKIYHGDFLGIAIAQDEIVELAEQFSQLVLEKVIQAPFVPGAQEFIKRNYQKYKLFISSATPQMEVKEICQCRNLINYFCEIFGSPEGKASHIDKILTKYVFKSHEVVFVGDALSDLQAAEIHGLDFIARIDPDSQHQLTGSCMISDIFELDSCLEKISAKN